MKINKKGQYAFLLVSYLLRAGRASIQAAATNMSLCQPFLHQVAGVLRRKGIVRAIRGPGGGYELVGDPTVLEVLRATKSPSAAQPTAVQLVSQEHRALFAVSHALTKTVNDLLALTVRDCNSRVVKRELEVMEACHYDA